jgi:hypothetical protein
VVVVLVDVLPLGGADVLLVGGATTVVDADACALVAVLATVTLYVPSGALAPAFVKL